METTVLESQKRCVIWEADGGVVGLMRKIA